MADRLRVVIADDHYLVREGTRAALEDVADIEVVAAVATAVELETAVARLEPDVVVTDIRMPPSHHTEGIDVAHRLRAARPGLGVVVLSQYARRATPSSCSATAPPVSPTCSRSAWVIPTSW